MSYQWKGALWRLGRVLFYGAVSYGIEYLSAHLAGYHLPEIWPPVITALLVAIDKWVRERKAELK